MAFLDCCMDYVLLNNFIQSKFLRFVSSAQETLQISFQAMHFLNGRRGKIDFRAAAILRHWPA